MSLKSHVQAPITDVLPCWSHHHSGPNMGIHHGATLSPDFEASLRESMPTEPSHDPSKTQQLPSNWSKLQYKRAEKLV